jgi:hypothetical protein
MRDILIDCLPIIDLLEVTPSTNAVASLIKCDQSSVSRIYRHVSQSLDLGFRKINGTYRAHRNQEVLSSLRQASQLMRLHRGAAQLNWVGSWWNEAALLRQAKYAPLPRHWQEEARTLQLLDARVLDLAVVCGMDLLACQVPLDRKPMSWGSWVAIGLVRYPLELRAMLTNPMAASDYQDYSHQSNTRPICTDIALIRSENLERPAIQELIKDIRTAYHKAYENNHEIEHL